MRRGRLHRKFVRENPLDRMSRSDLNVAGHRIRVYELSRVRPADAEAPDLPVFVLIHGLGVSSRYFVPLSERLAQHGRVILFDLPGFAGLPKPPQPLSMPDFARVVKAALDEFIVDNPILVGHSMGAQVVVELLAQHPGYASDAMLIGPVVNAEERNLPTLVVRFLESARRERPLSAAVSVAAYFGCGPAWFMKTLPEMIRYRIEDRIGAVTATIVIVGGRLDRTSPLAWRERLAGLAARGRVVTIDDASHQVMYVHSEQIAEELLALAGIGTAGVA